MASNTSSTDAVCYLNLAETTTSNNSSTNGNVVTLPVAVPEDRQYSLTRYLARSDQLAPDHPEYCLRTPIAFKPQVSNRESRRQNKRRMEAILRAVEAKLNSSG
ncbi:hypothetical protein BHE90_013812 [Fusarium euwallaceae]|uniref:Uncharacterized protein n=4 Tax=Fusarium solani species complex TaxID=232080 RepID=A0A3M2RMX4_9HYPO|nr:hypothetical protein CDV36_013754 [Fusarium kuroshium]RSL96289.1 hypothetical protein CDV31_013543 [Fusarium ambrosium]RSM05784.1 hypothetical protein CEP52_006102 [Fusarium oligoseptatum]RTE71773.1 hypothetical protein BHE90_013812 [Fusarium euwallaceae]